MGWNILIGLVCFGLGMPRFPLLSIVANKLRDVLCDRAYNAGWRKGWDEGYKLGLDKGAILQAKNMTYEED